MSPSISSDLELFPSGDIPDEDGLGLVIRAPLGVHRFTVERYPFVDERLQPVSPGLVRGQIDWLSQQVRRVDPDPYLAALPRETPLNRRQPPRTGVTATQQSPIAVWLVRNDIRDVVGRYVTLNRSGVGRCPRPEFHKHGDRHPSFAVFDTAQKWWCFTERIGGNRVDFLCWYHHLDSSELLSTLSSTLAI